MGIPTIPDLVLGLPPLAPDEDEDTGPKTERLSEAVESLHQRTATAMRRRIQADVCNCGQGHSPIKHFTFGIVAKCPAEEISAPPGKPAKKIYLSDEPGSDSPPTVSPKNLFSESTSVEDSKENTDSDSDADDFSSASSSPSAVMDNLTIGSPSSEEKPVIEQLLFESLPVTPINKKLKKSVPELT